MKRGTSTKEKRRSQKLDSTKEKSIEKTFIEKEKNDHYQ